MTTRIGLAVLVLLWSSCSDDAGSGLDAGVDGGLGPDGGEPTLTCNGHEELCDRRFDQVSFAMTHNAMSNAEAGWLLPNQNFGITRQLGDGIRGMMLDTYDEEGELLLCHAYCSLGSQPLVDGLAEIAAFLSANPHEVLSIIFENYITHAQTAEAFEQTGLIDFVYAHQLGGSLANSSNAHRSGYAPGGVSGKASGGPGVPVVDENLGSCLGDPILVFDP
jgi:hypothetical protein